MSLRFLLSAMLFVLLYLGLVPVWADTNDPPPELSWDDLVPSDWRPEAEVDALMEKYKVDELDDDDPKVAEVQAKIDAIYADAPVVKELDGKRVRLPGFVVPLSGESGAMDEFLLVPYYGACIHVPPPPVNQTVFVVLGGMEEYRGQSFDTVMVTGLLRVEHSDSGLAEAGYRLEGESVEPYRK